MKIAQSFSYIFKDGSWFFKVFIGGLFLVLGAVGVGLPFLIGYEVKHIRSLMETKEEILPEWKNTAKYFKEGIVVLFATLVYIALALAFSYIAGTMDALARFFIVLALVVFFWMPLLLIQYAKRPTLLSCFSLIEITLPATRQPTMFLAGLATSGAVMVAVIALGWMSLVVGWPFVVFWGMTVQSHILGQLARLQS